MEEDVISVHHNDIPMLDTMQVLGIFQNQLGGALPVLVRTSLEIYPVTWILLGSVYTLCFRAF